MSALFTPLRVGALELANRVVIAPNAALVQVSGVPFRAIAP
jgi:2,4-dienoyl-CoA reductase-like NADH-dependent reductase (Old Yellow Enzyme family)